MADKLIAIDTADPQGSRFASVVNDEIKYLIGQNGGGGGTGSVGPAGPQGPAGADGAPGATGPAGPAGADGADGAPGPAGPAGADGAVGADGEPGAIGPQGEQGIPGLGITFRGSLPTTDDLPDGAEQGDLYLVETPAPAHGWVWDDAEQAYVDAGPIQGPQGPTGPAGPQGPAGADGTGSTYTLPVATASVLGGVKVGTGLAVDGTGTLSATVATGFLPLAGGDMTGTITLPSGSVGLAVKGTNYNVLGGSGGVAYRNGTSNIVNFTGGEIVNYVPLTTPATGVGVKFGSGGPSLSKSGTSIASSAPITVAAAPANPTELANKAYVDSKAGGGGVSADEGNILTAGTDGLPYSRVSTTPNNALQVFTDEWQPGLFMTDRISYTEWVDDANPVLPEDIIPITRWASLDESRIEQAQAVGRAWVTGPTAQLCWLDLLAQLRTDLELDSLGGGVTNPVAGSVEGLTLWLGTQAEYDTLTPDASTIYYIR